MTTVGDSARESVARWMWWMWWWRRDLHVFADGAESLLLVLIFDGRLNGFEKIALRLQDLFDGLYPLGRGFLSRGVAHERAVRRGAAACRWVVPRIRRFHHEFHRFADCAARDAAAADAAAAAVAADVVAGAQRVAHFEFLVQGHFVHL